MASSQLDIRIRALVEGLDELRRLQGGLNDNKTEAESLADSFGKVSGPMGFLKDNAGKLATAFISLVAAYGLKESADYAARVEVLGTTLNVVAKNAGYSKDEIGKYTNEVKGLGITTEATRESLTQMIQAGLEIGPTAAGQVAQVTKLARAAQDLAVVTGENSSETLQKLITNIAQMDTMGLRFMGITLDAEKAQDKFALAIGKTTGELTQQQKVQAVANEALAQASALSGAYEASMKNVGKQLASLSRYQDELALAIGDKLLPAYYELVVVATKFLKVAEEVVKTSDAGGNGARDLAAGVKSFFTGLSAVMTGLLKIFAEIYPTIETVVGMFLELTGEILSGIGAIMELGEATDNTGAKVNALGKAIKDTIIIPLGIFIAGLKDGFTFIGAVVSGLTGAVLDFAGMFLNALGAIVGFFNKDLGDSIKGSGAALRDTAAGLLGYANDTVEKFGRGETALQAFNDKLERSNVLTKDLEKITTFESMAKKIEELTAAKRKSTMTDVELKDSAEKVGLAILQLGNSTNKATGELNLTSDEVQRLNVLLANVTKDSVQQFSEGINELGLGLKKIGGVEYLVPLSKEFDKMSGKVLALADNAQATSLQFRQAFSKGLDSAKTVADIEAIALTLKNAEKAGKDVGESQQQLVGKFQQVYAAAVKAASTKEDFALLNDQVKQLGEKGVLSAALVTKAMGDLDEKIKGTAANALLAAKNLTEIGNASLAVSKAGLAVAQSDFEVGKSRIEVWKAANAYAKDGTALNAEMLRLAELELKLAQARALEARAQYAEAQQNAKVLLATQEQILATKRLERDLDNESLILARDAATKKLEGETAVYEKVKQNAEKQQEASIAIQEQVLQQQLVVEQAKAAAEEFQSQATSSASVASSTASAAMSIGEAAGATTKMTDGLISSAAAASSLATNLRGATAEQQKLAAAISSVAQAQARLDAAMGTGKGSGGVLGDSTDADNANRKAKDKAGQDRVNGGTGSNNSPISTAWDIREKYNAGKITGDDVAQAQIAVDQARENQKWAESLSAMGLGSIDGNNGGQLLKSAEDALAQAKLMAAGGGGLVGTGPNRNTTMLQRGGGGGSAGIAGAATGRVAATGATASPVSTATTTAATTGVTTTGKGKVVTIKFTNDAGQQVQADVAEGDEEALLALLKKAKGVAA